MLAITLQRLAMLPIDRTRLAKGFTLNKMYFHGYVCRKIGHGKHTSVDNLGKGCPSELRPFLGTAMQELKSKNRLLITWPTSYGEQACVIANQAGYDFANAYNEYAHLPLMEYGKIRPKPKPQAIPPDELRKLKFHKITRCHWPASSLRMSEEPLYRPSPFLARFFAFMGDHILEEFGRTTLKWP